MDINFAPKLNKQSRGKYDSLMNTIAIVALACLGLIYIGGGTLTFSGVISRIVFGDTVAVDFIYLVINCIASFLMVYLPIKLFKFMQAGAYTEEYMPVEKEILNKKMMPYVFFLGLSATFVVAMINNGIVNSFLDYSGYGDDYLWRVGLKYNYQIFIYIFEIAVIPAIVEELFCRKLMCDALAPYGSKTAILVSSVIFALLHANFSMFLYTFVGGVFKAWLYVGTKNIKVPMLLHFINNFLGAISTVVFYRVSEDAYYTFVAIRMLISLFVGVACLWWLIKYKRATERERVCDAKNNGTYEEYIEHKRKYAKRLEMLPSEDGEEITPLTRKEKIKGFFSPFMIVFIVISLILALSKFA